MSSSTGSHTGLHAVSKTSSTLVRVWEILPTMCDSWRSTHVPAIAIHVVTFCPSITHGLNERRASTVAEPVDRANAAEQQASANGSGLSTGGFAADGFGFSPPHRSPFSFCMRRLSPVLILLVLCSGCASYIYRGGRFHDVLQSGSTRSQIRASIGEPVELDETLVQAELKRAA